MLPLNKFIFNILVLVMGLEPTRRIRQLCLRQSSMPIRVHQYIEHLGMNRTLNDFQILQRSAFLYNIILFVYSDTT